MSQNSILELLSVTNNAVKALDRTNSSKSSDSGGGTPRTGRKTSKADAENQPPQRLDQEAHDDSRSSADSGVCKTATQSHHTGNVKETAHDSDDSTTASDSQVRSTVVESGSKNHLKSLNSSVTSQGSRCRDLDNFNVAGAEKVKVSRKQLREIVSPRDSVENGISDHLQCPGQPCDTSGLYPNMKTSHEIATQSAETKPENGRVVSCISDHSVAKTKGVQGTRDNKYFPGQKKVIQGGDSNISVYTVERQSSGFSQFPYRVSRHGGGGPSMKEKVLVEDEDSAEQWNDACSTSSSQPEIVTVTERVVNISSQALVMSDNEDSQSQDSAVDMVSAVNRPQSYRNAKPKLQGPALRQGALSKSPAGPKTGKGDEVQISKFSLTDRERQLRDALSKRGSQSKPVKRVVHPKLVHSSASSVSDEGMNKNNNMDSEDGSGVGVGGVGSVQSITAVVAASAAAAATQPFLKMQQDMENKMQSLLAEMERVQKQVGGGGTVQSQGQPGSNPRLEQLEQQVKELTERRLQHLETLQSQQMELQAHLLSMSRDMTHSHHQRQPPSSSQHPVYFPTSISHTSGPSKASYNRALIERELMKGRLQGEGTRTYMEEAGGGRSKHAEESALDTPNPRSKPPRPAQFDGAKGGLLQEILAAESSPQLNTTFNLPHGQTPPVKLSRHSRVEEGGSPVDKARKLVHDLSNLEDRTAESIWSDRQAGSKLQFKAEEPAPLEYYLKRVRDANSSPYPKLGKSHRSHSASPSRSTPGTSKLPHSTYAPVQDKYGEARNVLHSVVAERETLEKNLELMLRSRQDVDVYAMMGAVSTDRPEAARIQKLVEKRISSLKDEVKREVEWDLKHSAVPTKSASLQDVGRRRGAGTKPAVGFGSGAPRMSKIDTGLHKSRSVPDTAPAPAKGKKVIRAKPAPKNTKIPYEDEEAMTQIYGKAQYQKGRTTVRDPYLHFQNQAKQRSPRLPSPKRANSVIDVRSSKVQTDRTATAHAGINAEQREGRAPRQFYFSPTRGYVPLSSSASAPVAGQLVPMAIPLGKPRMDPGLAVAPDDGHQSVSVRPARPVVTAASNVAMVSVSAEPPQPVPDRVPELGRQVLPPVDIDSLSPTSSPRGSDIEVKDPDTRGNAGFLQTFHYQESEEEEDKTLTEEASDEEQHGTGLSLPGYHRPPPAMETAKLDIPDRASRTVRHPDMTSQLREQGEVPWEERCDELAEDLRSRDVLQNKAKYWLEQELMARLLMKMYPVMSAQTEQQPQEEDVADRSDSIPDDESLLVGDTIGQRGLQLFVDAGQPVNNTLVNALVREVIAEKVGSMLGRRQELDSADSRAMGVRSEGREVAKGAMVDDVTPTQTDYTRPSRPAERVPTPQPTPPCTSPVPGFMSKQAPPTPPLTPPPPPLPPRDRSPVKDISSESSAPAAALVSVATSITPQMEPAQPPAVYESETEVSASLDISEEMRVLDAQVKTAQTVPANQSCHDVRTPTTTPPPTPPPQVVQQPSSSTPPPSPPTQPVIAAAPPPEAVRPSAPVLEVEVTADTQRTSKSPQPWGNPDSPGPELNPNFEEPSDMGHPQPRPLVMSVAVGTDTVREPRRSPSPQRRRTSSTDRSELDSLSSPSSATDTFNENVSEGQWLISRSEGQVAGLPLEDGMHRRAVEAVKRVDTSTASTLRDTEDLDLDDTDASRSEGEFLHKGDIINPETDPVLMLLMQAQHHPGAFRQYVPPSQVQHVLASAGRSAGELHGNGGQGYGATRRSTGELSEGQVVPGNQILTVTPNAAASYQETQGMGHRARREMISEDRGRSPSPGARRQANASRSRTPPGPRSRQLQYQPVSSGLPPSQSRRPLKSALVRSSEDSRYSRDSEPDSDRRGPPTEYGTRTLTPDQLNTEALLQTGTYMTRSMGSSGRQGSTKKSVEFDLSGTYEMSRRGSYRGSEDGFNSTAGSSDRLSSTGRSLGLRYSFEESESNREVRSSGLRMSVTIPTTEGGSDSDISEIDISESTGH